MRLVVRGFGPIEEAEVEVAPFTVVIGRNNAGKSILSQLIYMAYRIVHLFDLEVLPYVLLNLGSTSSRSATGREGLEVAVRTAVKRALESRITSYVRSYFLMEPDTLVNMLVERAEMRLMSDPLTMHVTVDRGRGLKVSRISYKKSIKSILDRLIDYIIESGAKHSRDIFTLYVRFMREVLGRGGRKMAIYVPAGRAGLIELYDAFISLLLKSGVEEPTLLRYAEIPYRISRTVVDFYTWLMNVNMLRRERHVDVDRLFENVLGGHIIYGAERPKPRMVYRFMFKDKSADIDILSASSMVKELAPIVLAFKAAGPGDLVIIEEPESHLHPGLQTRLMDVFLELVKRGYNLLITTHSEAMIWRLFNAIEREKIEGSPELAGRTAIYRMAEGERGFVTEKIDLSELDTDKLFGEFDRATDELYQETWSLYLKEATKTQSA